MYKVAVLGHQEITKVFVNTLIQESEVELILGASLDHSSASANDFVDMAPIYNSLNCSHIYLDDYSLHCTDLDIQLEAHGVEIVLVVGWSRLIPEDLIKKYTFIGWHGGAYPPPRCRGRAGVNWALINRHRIFYYYTMLLDSGVDSGKILSINDMSIDVYDTARTIYLKLGFNLVDLFISALPKLNQDPDIDLADIDPTLLPGRKPEHGLINWYQSDFDVDLFVRALSTPYPNSFSMLRDDNKVTIKSGRPLGCIPKLNLKPGEIYQDLAWGGFIVGCSSGNYLVEEYSIDKITGFLHGECFVESIGVLNPTIKY